MSELSHAQMRSFFAALRKTTVGEDSEAYRRRILLEELGVEHMSQVSSTDDYEKLMTRMALDRGDYEDALRYSAGSLRRLHYLIGAAAKHLVVEERFRGSGWRYLAGILVQAGMVQAADENLINRLANPEGWMDFTELQMKKVLMMLQKQLRRLAA